MPTIYEKAKIMLREYVIAASVKHQALVFATVSAGKNPDHDKIVQDAKKRVELYKEAYQNFDEEPLLGFATFLPED